MIDPGDIVLLQNAISKVREANAILNFVSDHFRAKYKLPDGASITPNGEIVLPPSENERFGGQFGLWDMQDEVAVSSETA